MDTPRREAQKIIVHEVNLLDSEVVLGILDLLGHEVQLPLEDGTDCLLVARHSRVIPSSHLTTIKGKEENRENQGGREIKIWFLI